MMLRQMMLDDNDYQEADKQKIPQFLEALRAQPQNDRIDVILKNDLFKSYLRVMNHLQKKEIKVTKAEVAKAVAPLMIAYGVGGTATLAYIEPSQTAAGNNTVNKYLNPTGAMVMNSIVNGYFFHLVISAPWENLITRTPSEVSQAMYSLQNQNPKLWARIARGIKEVGIGAIIMACAIFSAYPSYALDKSESEHPEWLSDIILFSNSMLLYQGVKSLVLRAPLLFSPFKSYYRKHNEIARNNYNTLTTLKALKNAHLTALDEAIDEVNKLQQTGKYDQLRPLYNLLDKKDPSLADTVELFFVICDLAKTNPSLPPSILQKVTQYISLVVTGLALLSLFLMTKTEAAKFAHLENPAAEWSLGAAIFFATAALSLEVSWEVSGSLYDIAAYAVNGVKATWNESTSMGEFLTSAWRGKASMASWHKIFRLPLSMQQNPKLMLVSLSLLYTLSYWSTQTSTRLNEEQLGEATARYFEALTIISTMTFNSFPVDKVFSSIQRFGSRIFGTERETQDIQLIRLLENQKSFALDIDEKQFLSLLKAFCDNPLLDETLQEEILIKFLGNKTAEAIFGEQHEYAKSDLRELVRKLSEKNNDNLTTLGFFQPRKQREEEGTPLLTEVREEVRQNYSNGQH